MVIPQVLHQPFGHLAIQMEGGIIGTTIDAVILIGIIGTFKIHVILYKRLDHFNAVLEMHIIIRCTMDDQVITLDQMCKVDR